MADTKSGHPWWRGATIYQVYIRSFKDSTGSGVGDLQGIISKVDYIQSLGAEAIWITPFVKSPMKDFGYDVSNYREVDPLFGTNADLEQLIATLHARGMKLVVDLVFNHTSDKHPWFLESRENLTNSKADWYIWHDPKEDGSPPNNWQGRFGGSGWTYEPRRGQYYFHSFLAEQPDLNFRNPVVVETILGELRYWLDMGVDGIRLDACNHFFKDASFRDNPSRKSGKKRPVPYDMQQHIHDRNQPEMLDLLRRIRAITDMYEERFVVAELGGDNGIEMAASYVCKPDLLHTAYCFSLLKEDPLSIPLFRNPMELFAGLAPDGWLCWSSSNHDAIRPVSRWSPAPEYNKSVALMTQAMLLCLRGSLIMYQGQELGLPEAVVPYEKMQDPLGIDMYPLDKGRDGSRTPMPWQHDVPQAGFSSAEPWLPIPDEHLALAVDVQEADPGSVLQFTRHLASWRKAHPAILWGDMTFLDTPEDFLGFERRQGEEKIVCLFNLTPRETSLPSPQQPQCDGVVPAALQPRWQDGKLTFPPFGFCLYKV